MRFSAKRILLTACLAMSLFSCLDHRLGGPLSPVRLRLASVQSGSAVTTYGYSSLDRLVTMIKSDGSLGVVSYGDPTRKYVSTDLEAQNVFYVKYSNPADQSTGEITRYPYNADGTYFDGTSFTAIKYPLVNSKLYYGTRLREIQYTFDVAKHLSHFEDRGALPDLNASTYVYTGENITTENFSLFGGHASVGTSVYTYDDKINPFLNVLDPDIDVVQRFSHNNITSVDLTSQGTPHTYTTYDYEYNQQGLPTKRTKKQGGAVTEVLTYTYESY